MIFLFLQYFLVCACIISLALWNLYFWNIAGFCDGNFVVHIYGKFLIWVFQNFNSFGCLLALEKHFYGNRITQMMWRYESPNLHGITFKLFRWVFWIIHFFLVIFKVLRGIVFSVYRTSCSGSLEY